MCEPRKENNLGQRRNFSRTTFLKSTRNCKRIKEKRIAYTVKRRAKNPSIGKKPSDAIILTYFLHYECKMLPRFFCKKLRNNHQKITTYAIIM